MNNINGGNITYLKKKFTEVTLNEVLYLKRVRYTVPNLHHAQLENQHDFTTVDASINKILKLLCIYTPQSTAEFVTTAKKVKNTKQFETN